MNNIASGQLFVDHFPVRTSTGAPTTMTDGSLYVLLGTSVTGGITTGVTLATTDKVGLYQLEVDTASATTYPAGSDYSVIAQGTVAGVPGVIGPVSKFAVQNRPELTAINNSYASEAALINALPTIVAPTVAQMNARTLTSAEYATATIVNNSYASTALSISNAYASLVAQVATATSLTALQNSVNTALIDIADIPTNTEFNARTMLTALYATHTDTDDIDTAIAALPTITYTQLTARTLPSLEYATNTDMDSAIVTLNTILGVANTIPTTASSLSTTQDATLSAIPTTTAFNARTLPTLEYATNTDMDALTVLVNAIPTTTGVVTITSTDITSIATQTAAAIAGGGDTTVRDQILDDATPISGAKVSIRNNLTDTTPFATAYTDDTGYFTLALDTGTYYGIAEANAFVTDTFTLRVASGVFTIT